MKYGMGSLPFAFLIPRVFVLDDHEVLLSEFRGDPLYFVVEPDSVTVEAEQVVLNQGSRIVRLSAASTLAQEDLKDRVKQQFRKGNLEFIRHESDEEPPDVDVDGETSISAEEEIAKAEQDVKDGQPEDTPVSQ
jgi:hypothetical protein